MNTRAPTLLTAAVISLAGWRSLAQTLTTLTSLDVANFEPTAPLVQGIDGNFYGTSNDGGAQHIGSVFMITSSGTLTTLHSFNDTDGKYPHYAGLVQATDGNLYGTTFMGGPANVGTVFKMTPSGILTTLYGFNTPDANLPAAGVIQATDGNLYGTTESGGANNLGAIFKISLFGTFTTLHSFTGGDGASPQAALIEAAGGDFYGTTDSGGANNSGTIFRVTPSGTLTSLYSFSDHAGPALAQAANGNFYGTTVIGGANGEGTIFEITPSGSLTTLYNFCAQSLCSDGSLPFGALIRATDGNLYGTTHEGGANKSGTIFKITPSGSLTTLHDFAGGDGGFPAAALIQATDGDFYGTTEYGGSFNCPDTTAGCGTVFRLSMGLAPFVKTLPISGAVGANVTILGINLTRASSVTFNGTVAAFTVNASGSAIFTTVPSGATTGAVRVTMPGGTWLSNVAFRVVP